MDTDLYELYKNAPFYILSKEEYISLICDGIEILPPKMVIHRLTGDGKKGFLIDSKWNFNKLGVLSGIDMKYKRRGIYQGIKYIK